MNDPEGPEVTGGLASRWGRLSPNQRAVIVIAAFAVLCIVVLSVRAALSSPACGDYCTDTSSPAYTAGEADGRTFAQQRGMQATPDGTTTDCGMQHDPMEPNKFGYTSAHDFMNFNLGFAKGCGDVARAAVGLPPINIA